MSAALKSLASAAATTLYDAIGRAKTAADLDELAKSLWRGYADGMISEADATEVADYIQSRRPVCRYAPRQATFPGFPLPERNHERVGRVLPKRKPQRRSDRQRSLERRRLLANSGVLPPLLTVRLTESYRACLRIIADEYRRDGQCVLSLPEIAARAGVDPKTAKRAQRAAQQQRLISVQERPVVGQPNLSNVITIISLDWLRWLRHGAEPAELAEGGGQKCPSTDIYVKKADKGGADRVTTAPTTDAALPQGSSIREAAELARELADIAGHRHGNLPRSWCNADPPKLVQGWIDQGLSAGTLRLIAAAVMERKGNSFDPTPPHSPRYFAAEIRKFVARRAARSARDRRRRAA